MKANINILIVLISLSLTITACGPGQLLGPTITPSPTITLTPTATSTVTPSPTNTPKPTFTPTPTPACLVKAGEWKSSEVTDGLFLVPLLTFVVKNCHVTSVDIWAFPARGELFWAEIAGPITVQDNGFSYTQTDVFGSFTLEGTFDSDSEAHGTLFFPKGFNVVDYILPDDVTIIWSAHP